MAGVASNPYGSGSGDRVVSLVLQGRSFAFPCDASGNVELDRLTEAGRNEYLFARIMIRHERFERPARWQLTRVAQT